MKQIYEVSFKVTGPVVDINRVLKKISELVTDEVALSEIYVKTQDDEKGIFERNWQEYLIKKANEDDEAYKLRISNAKAELEPELKKRHVEYRTLNMKLSFHKAFENTTEEDLDRIFHPEKYYTKVRKIEFPGIEMCKEISWGLVGCFNAIGPSEHLEELDEEGWVEEAQRLISNLECKEHDTSFDLVINYLGFKLNWEAISE